MEPVIITAILSLVVGFALGYIQKVRETDEYIHVVQVNGTLIEGKFQAIGKEELNKLNDLVFDTYRQNYKILQILVKTKEKVVMYVGTQQRANLVRTTLMKSQWPQRKGTGLGLSQKSNQHR